MVELFQNQKNLFSKSLVGEINFLNSIPEDVTYESLKEFLLYITSEDSIYFQNIDFVMNELSSENIEKYDFGTESLDVTFGSLESHNKWLEQAKRYIQKLHKTSDNKIRNVLNWVEKNPDTDIEGSLVSLLLGNSKPLSHSENILCVIEKNTPNV